MKGNHSNAQLRWIKRSLQNLGIMNYRFCLENDSYVCTENGDFYSVCHRQTSRAGNPVEFYRIRKLKGSIDKYGYRTYRITDDRVKKHLKGHRLMLNAWIGPQENLVVNHKDGDKLNNALSNLEWCTVAENNQHAISMGLNDAYDTKKYKYKIPLCDWVGIYILHKHLNISLNELGRRNGCSHDTIKAIIQRLNRVMPQEVLNGC